MHRQQFVSLLGLAVALIALVTSGATWSQIQHTTDTENTPSDEVLPEIAPAGGPAFELGTHMATLSRRVSTLWFAAKAGSQAAADYEITEMGEVMSQIIAAAPVVDGTDVDIPGVLDALRNTHFDELRTALRSGDHTAFEARYKAMLDSCNSCHREAGRPFIQLKIPARPLISNRDWSAGMK